MQILKEGHMLQVRAMAKRGPKFTKIRNFPDDPIRQRLADLIEERSEAPSAISTNVLNKNPTYLLKFLDHGTPKYLPFLFAQKLAAHFDLPVNQFLPNTPSSIQEIDSDLYAMGAPVLDWPDFEKRPRSYLGIRFLQAIVHCADKGIRDKESVQAKVAEYLRLPLL